MGLFAMRHKGNRGTLAVPSMGGLGKCKDMSREIEVDIVEGSVIFMVEPYWLRRVCKLTSNGNVIR